MVSPPGGLAAARPGGIEGPADAIALDLPDPWNAEETILAAGNLPLIEVRTVELLEREPEVREQGVRSSFAALGHTGYLTVARKVTARA